VAGGGADGGQRALQPVELALVVEALGRRPLALDDVEELVGAPVPGRLVGEVAIAGLVGVVAAGDDVQGDPARVARKPGRCASSTPSRSVAFSIWLATMNPSGMDELCAMRTRSKPDCSCTRAMRSR
jgi:hypothetical protein